MINDLQILVLLTACMISLTAFTCAANKSLRVFSVFLLVNFLLEITSWYLARVMGRHNIHVYNILTLIMYPFYGLFYYGFFMSKTRRKAVLFLVILYFLFALLNLLFIQGIWNWNSYSVLAGCAFNVFLSLSYLIQILGDEGTLHLSSDPVFWISLGVLLFYLVNIPYISVLNYLTNNFRALAKELYIILKALYIVMYLLFIMAFLCRINIRKY